MIPTKLDLVFWRGISFELELISQIKTFTYDPAVNDTAADLQRTHAENLKHHGFVYAYIDFLATYTVAELIIKKPFLRAGQDSGTPLLTLTLAASDITLTDQSVQIAYAAADTLEIDFSAGSYELLLTTAAGKVDGLVFGDVKVLGKT